MKEKAFLLQILTDHLLGKSTIIPNTIDFNEIIDCARKHNVEGIVYSQLRIQQLQRSYAATLYSYVNRENMLLRLEKELKHMGIKYFVVKGFTVAKLYPQPQLRTMGDCDVVIHSKDKEKVHMIMTKLGAQCDERGKNEWKYYLQNMEFEIHDHLMYEDERNPEKAVQYFESAWKYVNDNILDWNFHFVFLIYHIRKHIMGEGVGLRQFMDLAVIIQNVDLNWNIIKNAIMYLDLQFFFQRVLSLLKSWFNTEIVACDVSVDQDFVNRVTEKILQDGVFGFSDSENQKNMVMAQVYAKGKIYNYKRLMHALFLPYRDLIKMPEYRFIVGKKYLTPVAWAYRIIRKWKKLEKIKESFLLSDEKVDARVEYLKQWGLL